MRYRQEVESCTHRKLYNIFLPIWIFWAMPPVIIESMAINFLVDSLLLILCIYPYRDKMTKDMSIIKAYVHNVWRVWAYGFLADLIGALLLFLIVWITGALGIENSSIDAISRNPFETVGSLIGVLVVILMCSLLIYSFNRRRILPRIIHDTHVVRRLALIIALVTAPWTFLIPTSWFWSIMM